MTVVVLRAMWEMTVPLRADLRLVAAPRVAVSLSLVMMAVLSLLIPAAMIAVLLSLLVTIALPLPMLSFLIRVWSRMWWLWSMLAALRLMLAVWKTLGSLQWMPVLMRLLPHVFERAGIMQHIRQIGLLFRLPSEERSIVNCRVSIFLECRQMEMTA